LRIAPIRQRGDASAEAPSEFVGVGETTPVRAAIVRRINRRFGCQEIFATGLLSSAAKAAAYSRAGARMKMLPPVGLDLAVVDPIAPLAQARGRQEQRRRTSMKKDCRRPMCPRAGAIATVSKGRSMAELGPKRPAFQFRSLCRIAANY
jgi:hypothetical protein